MRRKKPNFKELTKNIVSGRSYRQSSSRRIHSKDNSLRKQLLATGVLCKDCHRYLARSHYSVCKRCYNKRIQRLVRSGGIVTLTPKVQEKIDQELQV
ncbi:MAG: hypothetical protein PXY39_03680 [archaeon]|nr:hypothetical protein [archaeon]